MVGVLAVFFVVVFVVVVDVVAETVAASDRRDGCAMGHDEVVKDDLEDRRPIISWFRP